MDTSNNEMSSLAYVINVHQRLVQDALHTPYKEWCMHVHNSKRSLVEKWEGILNWTINPSDYDNPSVFASDWQLYKLLSKLSLGGQPTEVDKANGYQKFLDAEGLCSHHNDFVTSRKSRSLNALMHYSGKIVAETLGDITGFFDYVEKYEHSSVVKLLKVGKFRPRKVDEAILSCEFPEFGKGVSVGEKLSKLAGPTEKLLLGTVTKRCLWMAQWLTEKYNLPKPILVRGSVLTFVAKRVGEARTICYEPSMNMLIQKLIGRYIKYRLKVVLGIDLKDQTRNQALARLGSLCDSYATSDMSAASDLWSFRFVQDQLPFEWFSLLDDCRSHEYYDPLKKDWQEFAKFSTMGNGFTFELETLLFFAVVKSAIWLFDGTNLLPEEVSVYGDDIIFPKAHYHTVEQALRLCGHRPNHEKSFASGPFRESCGGDFFKGWNVTPVKIKEFDIERTRHRINLFNQLSARDRGIASDSSISIRASRALTFVRDRLVRDNPRLASGPDEFVVNKLGWSVFTSSDRWLCDQDTVNNVWSTNLQTIKPKWVFVEESVPITDYEAHPCSIGYFSQYGSSIRNLFRGNVSSERSRDPIPIGKFIRNPALVDTHKVPTTTA